MGVERFDPKRIQDNYQHKVTKMRANKEVTSNPLEDSCAEGKGEVKAKASPAVSRKLRRANETPLERETRLAKGRSYYYRLTPVQRNTRRLRIKKRRQVLRQIKLLSEGSVPARLKNRPCKKETLAQKTERLAQNRLAYANLPPERKEKKLASMRSYYHNLPQSAKDAQIALARAKRQAQKS